MSNTSTAAAERDSQTFHLPDGRVLGYAEYGSLSGTPLFFFHGFPSSRLEARGLDQIARKRNIRVIAPDRPGFGLSTFCPHRRITDWPADVQALARHLNLGAAPPSLLSPESDSYHPRFAVLGGSGGGPYALACAYALPQETLSAVGILAGAPPWVEGMAPKQMPWYSWVTFWLAQHWPGGCRWLTDGLVGMLRWGLNTRFATRWLDELMVKIKRQHHQHEHEEEGTSLIDTVADSSIDEMRKRALRTAFEAFAQGAEGFVQEAQLLPQPDWGFPFEDVTYDQIQMWHGTQDKNAPVSLIRYMAERLPHCVLREFEGATHFTIHRHLEEIVSELIPGPQEETISSSG